MQTLLQDMRHAARNLLRSRGFAVVATLTLAVGIGANTAIFSIIETVLLRPLPYRDSEQLMRLNETESAPGRYPFAGPDYVDWKTQNRTFQEMTLFGWPGNMNLSGQGQPEHVMVLPTEANFFALLGVRPALGRTWAKGEDQAGKEQVAILNYGLWRSRFGGDPATVGKTIELDSRKYVIVGVMPASFRLHPRVQVWIPLTMDEKGLGTRGNHWASAIGRLKSGVSMNAAQADLSLIAARLQQQYPDSNHEVGATIRPLREDLIGGSRSSLVMMLAAVGLVLLIACANVANLLLTKAVTRQKEMAIRCALGAGRMRLLRQLLTESLLLGVVGAGFGLLLGWGIIEGFSQIKSFSLPQFNMLQLNGTVLLFTCGLALATGVLFGVFPALQASRPNLHDELKGGSGSSISPGKRRRMTSNVLVVGEIALALLLLISAGLLLKDFMQLRNLDIGVRTEGVWTAAIQLPEANYGPDEPRFRFAQALLAASRQIPGVQAAAVTNRLPLEGGSNYYINIRGEAPRHGSGPLVETHDVSPDYFRVMGIRLLEGRGFTAADEQAALALEMRIRQIQKAHIPVTPAESNAAIFPCVINEAMARQFWPSDI